MIKVVLDTNIYVSAFLKPGSSKPARILGLVTDEELNSIISEEIVEEVRGVLCSEKLKKYHRYSLAQIEEFIKKYTKAGRRVLGILKVKAIVDDPDDNKFLAAAVEGGADFIISGDHHLTDLKEYQGIKIVKPAEFLELWKNTLSQQ